MISKEEALALADACTDWREQAPNMWNVAVALRQLVEEREQQECQLALLTKSLNATEHMLAEAAKERDREDRLLQSLALAALAALEQARK